MPRHNLPQASVCRVCGALVADPALHDDWHAAQPRWTRAELPDTDNADTVSLPPVRDSIGPRRRPPAVVAAELRAELLQGQALTRALLEELARYDQESGE